MIKLYFYLLVNVEFRLEPPFGKDYIRNMEFNQMELRLEGISTNIITSKAPCYKSIIVIIIMLDKGPIGIPIDEMTQNCKQIAKNLT